MKITENVYQLESTKYSHAFLVKGEENILIDTGMPGLAKKILEELESLGAPPDTIRTILLTHHDIDHIGNAKQLQEATGADIWAPENDIPYINGGQNRPGVKHVIQTLVKVNKPDLFGSYTINQNFGEISPIYAPGHTPGHTIFKYRNVLFTGDLFKIKNGCFKLSPGFMTWDQNAVKKSISLLKKLDFEWLCPAHGEPIQNGPTVKDFLSLY